MIYQSYYNLHQLFGEKKSVNWILDIQANIILNFQILTGYMFIQQSAIVD